MIKIHLIHEKTTIILPVTPESYSISSSQNHQTVNVIALGDLNLMGNKGLRELSFSSFFPFSKVHGGYTAQDAFKNPFTLCKTIQSWKDRKKIVRVVITGTNINTEFLIKDFSYSQSDGSGDVYYSLAFSEYVRPKVTIKTGTVVSLAKNRSTKKAKTKTYKVKKGDTLKSIAKAKLGSSAKFKELAKLNKISSPYKLKVGQVIKIK